MKKIVLGLMCLVSLGFSSEKVIATCSYELGAYAYDIKNKYDLTPKSDYQQINLIKKDEMYIAQYSDFNDELTLLQKSGNLIILHSLENNKKGFESVRNYTYYSKIKKLIITFTGYHNGAMNSNFSYKILQCK